jgi:predicted RNA methylase
MKNYVERPWGYFPSSRPLIRLMLRLAQHYIKPDRSVKALEPSAGDGRVAIALRRAGYSVEVCEVDATLMQQLHQHGFICIGRDFLRLSPMPHYNLIVMNPPFSSETQRGIDMHHIVHACRWLTMQGVLISVVSESLHTYHERGQQFRAFLRDVKAKSIALPPDIFLRSDRPVIVSTHLIIVRRRWRVLPLYPLLSSRVR